VKRTDPEPIHNAAGDAIRGAARAIAEASAVLGAETFFGSEAKATAAAVAREADDCFAKDLIGKIVADVDEKGLDFGPVHVSTALAACAEGRSTASPISAITVDHDRTFALPSAHGSYGSIEATGTLHISATYALGGPAGAAKTTIATKVSVEFAYSAPDQTTIPGGPASADSV